MLPFEHGRVRVGVHAMSGLFPFMCMFTHYELNLNLSRNMNMYMNVNMKNEHVHVQVAVHVLHVNVKIGTDVGRKYAKARKST